MFAPRYQPQMIRVDTTPVLTDVVNLIAVWDQTVQMFIDEPMRVMLLHFCAGTCPE